MTVSLASQATSLSALPAFNPCSLKRVLAPRLVAQDFTSLLSNVYHAQANVIIAQLPTIVRHARRIISFGMGDARTSAQLLPIQIRHHLSVFNAVLTAQIVPLKINAKLASQVFNYIKTNALKNAQIIKKPSIRNAFQLTVMRFKSTQKRIRLLYKLKRLLSLLYCSISSLQVCSLWLQW
ncbi:hypothetical protein FGO68_gene5038 [Halteria grandinella]|uniref:Uncharacterized protein n=1 Tax=Halteria grandinella TaxID=5974 RepID=A0A8J8SX42_HALGN|nr:hypothetical protein FGO68_gene5038 [Halteria grandinella]